MGRGAGERYMEGINTFSDYDIIGHESATDRCVVVMLSRAEPTPCRMRDGRSR